VQLRALRRPRAELERRTHGMARAACRRRRSRSTDDERRAKLGHMLPTPPTFTAAVSCGRARAPSTSVSTQPACRTSSASSPAGGGCVTSQSARVSARASGNASASAWPVATGTRDHDAARCPAPTRSAIGAPQVDNARIVHATPSRRARGVVLLGDEVTEEAVRQRFVAVRVPAFDVDRHGVLSSPMSSGTLSGLAVRTTTRTILLGRRTGRLAASW